MHLSTKILKRGTTIKHVQGYVNILNQRYASTVSEEKIEIPRRITRGPTDILRALEGTVGRDPTAAHYKYHDDPYLIPMSNIGKRTFAMAQEAGRKAARWVREQHPELFNSRDADPVISTFLPRAVYNEQSEVTEQDLINVINDVQVSDAKLIYKVLQDRGQPISEQVLEDLLGMICYFNEDDSLSDEVIEERWFRQINKVKDKNKKTWMDGGLAEQIFSSVENPTLKMYATIIQGMCKYYQVDRAYQLFDEAEKKGYILPAETYNCLIKVVNVIKESYDMRWSHMLNLLNDMNKAGIKPNLGTMNAVLGSLSIMGKSDIPKENALKILSEFKQLGIEPSLGSWYYVLITFCKERGQKSAILHDIMKQVENKSHCIQDHVDTNFFVTAMDIAANHLNDLDLGRRVNNLLHLDQNYNLIGDSYRESIYYRHYFNLHIRNTPLDDFMENTYNILVPNIYVPEPSVMHEILNQIDFGGAIKYVPKLWSDMVIFDHVYRENLITSILDIMSKNQPDPNSPLIENFANIGMDIHERIENQHEKKMKKLTLTGDQLGHIMTLQLRHNKFDKACVIFDKLYEHQNSIVGVPKWEDLSLFVDHCIENKAPARAIICIQYCSESGFPDVQSLGQKLIEKMTLDEEYLRKLQRVVGDVVPANKEASN